MIVLVLIISIAAIFVANEALKAVWDIQPDPRFVAALSPNSVSTTLSVLLFILMFIPLFVFLWLTTGIRGCYSGHEESEDEEKVDR